jgi:hypothetical protein
VGYKHWSKEEDGILLKLYLEETYSSIGERLGRPRKGVATRLRALGVDPNIVRATRGGLFWTREEEGLILSNYKNLTTKQMSNLFPCRTHESVQAKMSTMGLACERQHLIPMSHRIYGVDRNYFYYLTNESCYWAGFIGADGTILERDRGVKIGLQERDRWHLEKFAYSCGFSGPIAVYPQYSNKNAQNTASLTVNSVPEWLWDLNSCFNITPRKSLTLRPPNLNDHNYILSYIAGYIDGDGCIDIKKDGQPRISVYGTYHMLSFIKEFFDRVAPPANRVVGAKVIPKVNIFRYSICGKRVLQISDACANLGLPLLKRKWGRIKKKMEKTGGAEL